MTKEEAIERDVTVLRDFVGLYCRAKHGIGGGELCDDCRGLLEYATQRRRKCPHDPKPACSRCRTHCYRPDQRAKIREVMRFSGMRPLGKGRLSAFVRKLLGRKSAVSSEIAGPARAGDPDH